MHLTSFIIPARNESETIGACIDSINTQKCNDTQIEIIVIDNNSSDDTANISTQKGAKVLNIKSGNISAIRNSGVDIAKGDYVCFIDADCILPSDWLKQCIKHIRSDNVLAVASPEGYFGNDPTWVEKSWCKLKHKFNGDIKYVSWCSSQAMLTKRDFFLEIGGFNEKLVTCEDADLGYRISKQHKIVLDRTITHQHIRSSKTLKEIFNREKWRGQGNIKGLFSHSITTDELPSIIVPLIFGISFCLYPVLAIYFMINPQTINVYTILIPTAIVVTLPAFMTLKKLSRHDYLEYFTHCYLICFVYLTARFTSYITLSRRNW